MCNYIITFEKASYTSGLSVNVSKIQIFYTEFLEKTLKTGAILFTKETGLIPEKCNAYKINLFKTKQLILNAS